MAHLAAIATAVPPFKFDQAEVKEFVGGLYANHPLRDKLLSVFDNAMIDTRYFCSPMAWFHESHTFGEVNNRHIEQALDLSETVVNRVLKNAEMAPGDIDAIFFINTTGLSTPSIDALLYNRIPFSNHITRVPIWGLGCAGGSAGFARASEFVTAYPERTALVVSLELCSLAFHVQERSKGGFVSSALFGDGAGAIIVAGEKSGLPRPKHFPCVRRSLSTIYPDTLDVMGWDINEDGFHVVLSRDIPTIVEQLVKPNIMELLELEGLTLSQIEHYVTHPGGKRVLESYAAGLGIGEDELRHSSGVLRDYGNMSSATVYFILERFLADKPAPESLGLMSALGPGFSSELVLLEF